MSGEILIFPSGKTTFTGSILREWSERLVLKTTGSLRVRVFTVFGKHGGYHVHHDIQFCLVSSGNIDEDISSIQSDFAML